MREESAASVASAASEASSGDDSEDGSSDGGGTGGGGAGGSGGDAIVNAWLTQSGLGSYGAMIDELGYDDIDLLKTATDTEVQELARDCIQAGMPQAHSTYLMQKIVELVSTTVVAGGLGYSTDSTNGIRTRRVRPRDRSIRPAPADPSLTPPIRNPHPAMTNRGVMASIRGRRRSQGSRFMHDHGPRASARGMRMRVCPL